MNNDNKGDKTKMVPACIKRILPLISTKSLKEIQEISKYFKNLKIPCHMQIHPSGNYISIVISSPDYTSLPSIVAIFLARRLIAVLQPSGYSVFHGRDTPIQLGLSWQSYFCQCLNTETSTRGNRGYTTETPSISYNIYLYIRLVVTL